MRHSVADLIGAVRRVMTLAAIENAHLFRYLLSDGIILSSGYLIAYDSNRQAGSKYSAVTRYGSDDFYTDRFKRVSPLTQCSGV